MSRRFLLVALFFLMTSIASPVLRGHSGVDEKKQPDFSGFDEWLQTTAKEARAKGIRPETIEMAFRDLEPDPRVIRFDRKQPEFVQTFDQYLEARVTPGRVRQARDYYQKEQALLQEIAAGYQVDPEFLVAFWGLESSFGRYQGKYSIIRSLATLGYDPRRSTFFTKELFKALQILDEGHVAPEEFVGGWAGAMGQNQFMPSSFLNYAADFDGDGKKNIWSSRADVWASIANYLHKNGWKKGKGWGAGVTIPEDLDIASLMPQQKSKGCRALRHHTVKKTPGEWQALGLSPDRDLIAKQKYALLVPDKGVTSSFLVGGNFRTILSYNCANKYAVSVGLLAEKTSAAD